MLGKPLTPDDMIKIVRAAGLTDSDIRHMKNIGMLSKIGAYEAHKRPWLAEGCLRSTWYSRRKSAREREALAAVAARSQAMFERDLDRCALAHAVMAREHQRSPCRYWNSVNLKKVSREYRTNEIVDADDDNVIR